MPIDQAVARWGWIFLVGYFALMLGLGYIGWRRVGSQDDYATARGGYGALVLALAYAATVASGSTFMGIPGMAYDMGFKVGYFAMLYPIGIYGGMMLVARITKKVGDRFGSQSVPDFLGDRYQSPVLRLLASLVALLLLFYIMAQIVAAGWLFEEILGLDYGIGIWVAGGILLLYLTAGGSHADILTDAVQGAVMLALTVLIVAMFVLGWGLDGGVGAVNAALAPKLQWSTHTDPGNPYFANWWIILPGMIVAHIGFTALPHLGNKFFALKSTQYMKRYMTIAAVVGMVLPLMFLGGIMGRAQGLQVENPDAVMAVLFVENMPPILAAFLGVAILSAIISTADGLIISVSQVFANDLYRKTYVPWKGGDPESPAVNQRALWLSRATTVAATLVAVVAVITPPEYLAILLWTGVGGIIVAYGGPYFVGTFREETSKEAAIGAFLLSFAFYAIIHLGPQAGLYQGWFPYNQNPYASGALGFILSCVLTLVISRFTEPLSDEHIDRVFSAERTAADGGRSVADND